MSSLLKIELLVPHRAPFPDFDFEVVCEDVRAWLAVNSRLGWEELIPAGGSGAIFRLYMEPEAPLAASLEETARTRWPFAGLTRQSQEQQDWAAAWKEFFTPVAVGGRFEVLPPWLAGADTHGREAIVIEPKMAFGTGHHATTALCLEVLAEMAGTGRIKPGDGFLDLGTGSGILAIGLVKLGLAGIGADIDPQAVCCAAENLGLNGLPRSDAPEARLRLVVGGLPCLAPGIAFDCIVANILAQPLVDMAREIVSRVKPGGVLVLSGLLVTQAEAVARAYVERGLPEPARRDRGEWSCLYWA